MLPSTSRAVVLPRNSLLLALLVSFTFARCAAVGPDPPVDAAPTNAVAQVRQDLLADARRDLAGREEEDVEAVYGNLDVLGGFPAENLLFAMEAWSEALGVDCTHCHIAGDYASDAKRPKLVARRMVELGERVNSDLRAMSGLSSERPGVSCATCHRGALVPARRMR